MPSIKTDKPCFLALPPEMRDAVYAKCHKQTLGRLAQTCKQVNAEINPVADTSQVRRLSPWDVLRQRHFPHLYASMPIGPQDASLIYQAALQPIRQALDRLPADMQRKRARYASLQAYRPGDGTRIDAFFSGSRRQEVACAAFDAGGKSRRLEKKEKALRAYWNDI